MTKPGSAVAMQCSTVVSLEDRSDFGMQQLTPAPLPHLKRKPKANHIQDRVLRLSIIAIMSIFCIASASCHTLFAQPFKEMRKQPDKKVLEKFTSPFLFALTTSGSFPLAFAFWVIVTRGRIVAPTLRQWKAFAMLAIPESLNIIFSSIGLDGLTAIEYAIIRGTSLIFVVGLSKLLTKKQFNRWQYAAVLMMTIVLVLISIKSDEKDEQSNSNAEKTTSNNGKPDSNEGKPDSSGGQPNNNGVQPDNKGKKKKPSSLERWLSLAAAVSGSIFVSILSVLTQKLFASEQSKGDITFICQINTCQSFLSTLIVLPCFLIFELVYIRETYPQVIAAGRAPIFWGSLGGMWAASPLMLFTNIGLTSFSSATFARSLGGPKRVVCVILGHLLFNEELNFFKIIATVLLFFSLGIYIYGGHLLQQSKRQSTQK